MKYRCLSTLIISWLQVIDAQEVNTHCVKLIYLQNMDEPFGHIANFVSWMGSFLHLLYSLKTEARIIKHPYKAHGNHIEVQGLKNSAWTSHRKYSFLATTPFFFFFTIRGI